MTWFCDLCCLSPSNGEGQQIANRLRRSVAMSRERREFQAALYQKSMQVKEVSFETTEESSANGSSAEGSFRNDDVVQPSKADCLDFLASQLARNVQKYPSSNKTLIKRPQDRFVAIMQNAEALKDPSLSEESAREARYKTGWLAYWEDEEGHSSGDKPKGCVNLLRIVKVQHERNTTHGRGVLIRHKKPSSETGRNDKITDLSVLLPDRKSAKEFSYALWEFLQRIRDQWREGQPSLTTSFSATFASPSYSSGLSTRPPGMDQSASITGDSSD